MDILSPMATPPSVVSRNATPPSDVESKNVSYFSGDSLSNIGSRLIESVPSEPPNLSILAEERGTRRFGDEATLGCIENGKKIFYNNENMRNLALIMEYPIFKEFFDKNFTNKDDINTIIMFMYLYRYVDLVLKDTSEGGVAFRDTKTINQVDIFYKLHIVNQLIKNPKTRNYIVTKFLKNKNK
jgi:hypothetical protein